MSERNVQEYRVTPFRLPPHKHEFQSPPAELDLTKPTTPMGQQRGISIPATLAREWRARSTLAVAEDI
jgi:hypothetical protein